MHAKDFLPHYSQAQPLVLELDKYPGGVAVWGALPAVFDTTNSEFDRGVHVHARLNSPGKKIIDRTFPFVEVRSSKGHFLVSEDSAVSFTMSSIFDIDIVELICPRCLTSHLDTGYDAVIPHMVHPCQVCGYVLHSETPVVSNSLITMKKHLDDEQVKRQSVEPNRSIILDPEQYSGGFQIWGSNPSIVWTAARLEESAIHVHAMSATGQRVVDNTYSYVEVEGERLDIEMIRVLQIQNALSHLPISSIACPACQVVQFDQQLDAVIPKAQRTCTSCHFSFESALAVSNPAFALLEKLRSSVSSRCLNSNVITG